MGDRGNIVVQDGRREIYMYTHWMGSDLPEIVAEGLERGRQRWGDIPYLNRILFCEMIKDDVMEETGFGLDTSMGDGGTEVYIDHNERLVSYDGDDYTYDEFISKFRKATS